MLLKSWGQLAVIRPVGVHCRRLVSEAKNRKPKLSSKMLEKLRQVMEAKSPPELINEVNQEVNDTESKTKRRKKRSDCSPLELRIPEKMQNYFNNHPDRGILFKTFPEKLLKIRKNLDLSMYIASDDSARVIADVLKKDLPRDRTLLEISPGLGLLSKLLINETDNDLMLYESDQYFHPYLNKLITSDSERKLKLNNADLASIWKLAYIDKMDQGNRVEQALEGVNRHDYEDESNARLFNTTASLSFIRHLINAVVFQSSLMGYGRCELFLCLPPPLFIHLTCSRKAGYFMYRPMTILFQILFEYELVCKVNRKDFLPWHTEPKKKPSMKLDRFNKIDPDKLYMMKAVPRRDLFKYCSNENLPSLWFFIKQSLRSRANRVIPSLEHWIPGCGPRLSVVQQPKIRPGLINPSLDVNTLPELVEPCRKLSVEDVIEDISIFTEFGDLSPSEILTIFDQFISWPEYKECSFSAALERTLIKLHTNPDDHVDGIELPEEADDDETKKSEKSLEKS